MKNNPDVLTPKQAAALVPLSDATIRRCIDNGTLEGWRVPGSRHRRTTREKLEKFCRQNDIPLTSELENNGSTEPQDSQASPSHKSLS